MADRKSLITGIILAILIGAWLVIHFQPLVLPVFAVNVKVLKNDNYVYGNIELGVSIPTVLLEWTNPFDTDLIQVTAYFSLADYTIPINGFFYQNYTRRVFFQAGGPIEWLQPIGPPYFMVRFTPPSLGAWKCFVEVVANSILVYRSQIYLFPVTTSTEADGFIRADNSQDTPVFRYDSGKLYQPIGINYAWPNGREGTFTYDYYFGLATQNELDFTRIWLAEWGLALEWTPKSAGYDWPEGFGGLGRYSLESAWRLDYVFQLAEELGINILLTINSYHQFSTDGSWAENPYNVQNGGPFVYPKDVFSDDYAKKMTKKLYTYVIARYASYCSLFGWEIFNNIDQVALLNETAANNWHTEMLAFFAANDPYNHLRASSYADPYKGHELWMNENTTFVNLHYYGADNVLGNLNLLSNIYHKPVFITEFGIESSGELEKTDEEGIFIHNALWGALFLGHAGIPSSWWWDVYFQLYPKVYKHYRAFRNFLDLCSPELLAFGERINYTVESEGRSEVFLRPTAFWGQKSPPNVFLYPNGTILNGGLLSRYIYGNWHPDFKTSPSFLVYYPPGSNGGDFSMSINSVGTGNANCTVYLDGNVMWSQELLDVDGQGADNADELNLTISFPVAEGQHNITIENQGNDWFSVNYYRFTNLLELMNAFSAINPERNEAALWLPQVGYAWWNKNIKEDISFNITFSSPHFHNQDTWLVLFLNTTDSRLVTQLLRQEEYTITNNEITFRMQNFGKDIALLLKKLN
ncbi:MAG: glycosyl hydrolase [Candidatus Hodarchaeota archaeon]